MKLFSPGEPPEKGEKGSGCQNIFLGNKIPFLLWQKKLILHCRPLFTPLYVWALLFFEGTIAHTRKGTLQTSILQFFLCVEIFWRFIALALFPDTYIVYDKITYSIPLHYEKKVLVTVVPSVQYLWSKDVLVSNEEIEMDQQIAFLLR